jgi:hypothetical protein
MQTAFRSLHRARSELPDWFLQSNLRRRLQLRHILLHEALPSHLRCVHWRIMQPLSDLRSGLWFRHTALYRLPRKPVDTGMLS